MSLRTITGTALLLALALLCQMIRLLIPVTPQMSMFGFGSLVSACLVIATWRYGIKSGAVIAWIAPIVAFMQGILPFFPFIFVVGIGNTVYLLLVYYFQSGKLWWKAPLAGLGKMLALFGGFHLLFSLFQFPLAVENVILFMMSWPQFITGTVGVVLAFWISRRLRFYK